MVAFVDPQSLLAQAMSGQQNPMTGQPGNMINTSSDLTNLFKAWGINYKKDMVLADMNYRGQLQGRVMPTALQLPSKAINQDSRFTTGLQSFTLMNAGSFGVDKKEGLDVTTLASSSEASEMIDTTAAEKLRREPMTNFTASGKKQIVGVHIKGKFKSAFPNGRPAAPGAPKESGGAEQDATAPAATATTPPVSVTTAPVEAPAAAAPAPAAAPAAAPAPAAPPAAPKKEEKKPDAAKPAAPATPAAKPDAKPAQPAAPAPASKPEVKPAPPAPAPKPAASTAPAEAKKN